MQNVIESIARSIVADEHSLEVSVAEDTYQTNYTLRASGADVGKLVGKKGRTIGAIRDLLDMAAEQRGQMSFFNVWVESRPSVGRMALAAK